MEPGLLGRVSALTEQLYQNCGLLEKAVQTAPTEDAEAIARYYHDTILIQMNEVRAAADQLELLVGKKYWPFPTYSDILFYV